MNQGTGANDTPLGTPVRMSPVNDTPVVEENTQSVPAPNTPKKRKAEPGDTESNVRFYQPLASRILMTNRIPLNRRRKRSGRMGTAWPMPSPSRWGLLVPLVTFLKLDRALIGEVGEEAQIGFRSYDDRKSSPGTQSPICRGTSIL